MKRVGEGGRGGGRLARVSEHYLKCLGTCAFSYFILSVLILHSIDVVN